MIFLRPHKIEIGDSLKEAICWKAQNDRVEF